MSNFPTSLDDSASLPNPGTTDKTNSPSHAALHSDTNAAVEAVEAKLGIGATTPVANSLLFGTGTGVSRWGTVTSAELLAAMSDETGTGSLVFATTPTLNTPKVDTINENTPANGVTVDSLNIKDGKLNTNNSVVTANVTDGAITNAKLSTTAGEAGGAPLTWSASPTNLSGGTTTVSRYTKVGRRVRCEFRYVLGGAGVAGSVTLTLPVAAEDEHSIIGTCIYADVGTSVYTGFALGSNPTTAVLYVTGAAGTYAALNATLSSTVPHTWASTDVIKVIIEYVAAA